MGASAIGASGRDMLSLSISADDPGAVIEHGGLVATLLGLYAGGLDDRPPLLDLRLLERS